MNVIKCNIPNTEPIFRLVNEMQSDFRIEKSFSLASYTYECNGKISALIGIDPLYLNCTDIAYLILTNIRHNGEAILSSACNSRHVVNGICGLIRSSSIDEYDEHLLGELIENDIDYIIDLKKNSKFNYVELLKVNKIEYKNLYFDQLISCDDYDPRSLSVSESYFALLSQMEVVKNIFLAILNAESGMIYFCKHGKDRTGVISILLGLLFNQSDCEIIESYLISAICLDRYFKSNLVYSYEQLNDRALKGSEIVKLLELFRNAYGSIENYLVICGLTTEQIRKIKAKYCEKNFKNRSRFD